MNNIEKLVTPVGERVLRKVFASKEDEVTEGWRKIHKEELSDLYSSPNIIRVIKSRRMNEIGGACGTYGRQERCIQGFGRET
jgi:hypothetical protein